MENLSFAELFRAVNLILYGQALVAAVVVWIVATFIRDFTVSRFSAFASKTKTKLDDALIPVLRSAKPFAFAVFAFAAMVTFSASDGALKSIAQNVILIIVTYQVVVSLGELVGVVIQTSLNRGDGKDRRTVVSIASGATKTLIWIFGVLVVFSNLGINITSLIAGLGIGGVAVAFALQRILADLFSSFAIYLDRPFEIGDYIITGEHAGIVEKVGLKTTRIRALQGEEIIIPNDALTSGRVQNFKQMRERRGTIKVGVLYETPHTLLKEIPGIIQKIVEDEEGTRFDRVHLVAFGDFAITFEVVFYALSGRYADYLSAQERILFAIKEAFDKKGIEFAYPTQTIYVKK